MRAHRVVLSACSTFFCDLFRTLEPPYHPVIVLPGATFSALVALLSFMYSGEVNVSEEQIPTLLTLAETLGIKGLADFNGVSRGVEIFLLIKLTTISSTERSQTNGIAEAGEGGFHVRN